MRRLCFHPVEARSGAEIRVPTFSVFGPCMAHDISILICADQLFGREDPTTYVNHLFSVTFD
jgi:hypothetical protein